MGWSECVGGSGLERVGWREWVGGRELKGGSGRAELENGVGGREWQGGNRKE